MEAQTTMIQKGLWQERTIQDTITLLEANEAVRALLLKGVILIYSISFPHSSPILSATKRAV
jgi:hypothetical protein